MSPRQQTSSRVTTSSQNKFNAGHHHGNIKGFKGSKHDSQLFTEFHGKPANQLTGYEISRVKDALHATKMVRDTLRQTANVRFQLRISQNRN